MGKRIVVIGAVAAGTKAAAKARRDDPAASITVLTEERDVSYAGCGLPYYVGGVIKGRGELVVRSAESFRDSERIEVITGHRADSIERGRKVVVATDLDTGTKREFEYDRLVLATGASAIVPDVPGVHLEGVFKLRSVTDADALTSFIERRRPCRAVVVGGGFIGLESAENLSRKGIRVSVVEMLEDFPPGFDPDMSRCIRNCVVESGVEVYAGEALVGIEDGGSGCVRRVRTNARCLDADMVLVAVGVRPNTRLAAGSGLALGPRGAILVDGSMRTSDPDIYAAGDCAATRHLVTGKPAWYPMGSTANKMGRVAGIEVAGAAGGSQAFAGVLGTAVFKVFDTSCARTGLTEAEAAAEGFDPVSATVAAPDRAHYYPGHRDIVVRLIADGRTRRVLGAQIVGEGVVDKPIDTLVTLISLKGTVDELSTLDLAYAPPFSSAMSPVITAANVLLNKMGGRLDGITAARLQARLRDPGVFLLDVRTGAEFTARSIPGSVNIPVNEIEARVAEVPRDRELIIICRVGRRAYTAYLKLRNLGFSRVEILDGGMLAYPYETQ
ncbi:MAG: FAD-dependent oxidoreductase [Firmicutes bacterium]|nr:FAD-dependent oxidoreductase [Bacillota bacterium]